VTPLAAYPTRADDGRTAARRSATFITIVGLSSPGSAIASFQSTPKVLSIWPTTRCGTGLSPCWPNLRSPERLAHRSRSPPFGRCPLRLRQSDERRHSSWNRERRAGRLTGTPEGRGSL